MMDEAKNGATGGRATPAAMDRATFQAALDSLRVREKVTTVMTFSHLNSVAVCPAISMRAPGRFPVRDEHLAWCLAQSDPVLEPA